MDKQDILKKEVMDKMVRDSVYMDADNYKILKRCYKLLGGNMDKKII